ncbi:DUF896 domain-containing protein [Hypnocyclicus thermotrophus]|nr:DUF896 domain-containing protein [Hypnocyclicus thermotrophus]
MEMNSIIKMVNYYSGLAKQRELTEIEKQDREKYRKIYLEKFRAQVRGHLDSIKIVNENEIN